MQYNILFLSLLAVFWRKKMQKQRQKAPVFLLLFKPDYIERQAFHESYKFFFRRRI